MNGSPRYAIKTFLLLLFGSALTAEACMAQSFQYPPYGAHRGRMVARDGIGHSVRYRWGNGLTPTGGAVLTSAIDAFAPAVIAVAGRDFDSGADSRDAARGMDPAQLSRLAAAQERANDLLVRTARLVDPTFAAGGAPSTPVLSNGSGGGTPDSTAKPPQIIGGDPWGQVEDNQPPAAAPATDL